MTPFPLEAPAYSPFDGERALRCRRIQSYPVSRDTAVSIILEIWPVDSAQGLWSGSEPFRSLTGNWGVKDRFCPRGLQPLDKHCR